MNTKHVLKWGLRIVATLLLLLVILLVGGFALLNTHWLQQKLLSKATSLLTEKLQTRVAVDSVSIGLLTLDAKLYGLTIDDQQQRPMLALQFVKADVDINTLLHRREVLITEARIEGVKARLHQAPQGTDSPDTIANYQFLLDAFKPHKKQHRADTIATSQPKKQLLAFDMSKIRVADLDITYNDDSRLQLSELRYRLSDDQRRHVRLQGAHLTTDNHQPRKNAGKPNHGAFDPGHLNLWADLQLTVDSIGRGTTLARLTQCNLRDTITGIDIRQLQCEASIKGKDIQLHNLQLQQGDTRLHIDDAQLSLPDKQQGTPLRYITSTITGTAVLRDIARPFAPVLSGFTLPLQLSVRMEGDDQNMQFHDVVVTRPQQLLSIKASGYISGLKQKNDLKVHFDVKETTVKGGAKEQIISQFPVKKFMMKQLHALGTIRYAGSLDVLYQREQFQGTLRTAAGALRFQFAIDEANKYVVGQAGTQQLNIGHVMDMPDIGTAAATAHFRFDISKPRTAAMRRRLGGKLPIGQVTAHVDEASYKSVKVHNLDIQIESNGAEAEGHLSAPRSLADLNVDFTFTNTSEMKKTKVKPRLKLHLGKKTADTDKQKKKK